MVSVMRQNECQCWGRYLIIGIILHLFIFSIVLMFSPIRPSIVRHAECVVIVDYFEWFIGGFGHEEDMVLKSSVNILGNASRPNDAKK